MNTSDNTLLRGEQNAYGAVTYRLNRSATRSASKLPIPQVVDKIGVPNLQILNQQDLAVLIAMRQSVWG